MEEFPNEQADSVEIERFGSIDDWRPVFGNEEACRRLFERWRWPLGTFCPFCGSLKVWRLRDGSVKKAGPTRKESRRQQGLWQCGDCRCQFTCTTNTPLHGTKLRLGKWLEAFYLVLGSSKGMSSVVLARHIGVTQTTAWKMGHAIREMLQDRPDLARLLNGAVEADSLYVVGSPPKEKHVYHKPGKGTSKQQVLVAVQRKGPVAAQTFNGDKADDLRPVMAEHIAPTASLMTDGDPVMAKIAQGYAEHHPVNHSQKVWSFDGNHVNTAEAYNLLIRRAMLGVYHRLSRQHLQRYLNELVFRWNQRKPVQRVYRTKQQRGRPPGKRTKAGKPQWVISVRPFEEQMAALLRGTFDRQLRWNKIGGLRWPERKPKSAHHEPPIAELLAALSGKTFPKPPDEDNIPF